MEQKTIISAQKVLRSLDKTPVKVMRGDGEVCWQVTFDNSTYNSLLSIISEVANTQIHSAPTIESIVEYHREKV